MPGATYGAPLVSFALWLTVGKVNAYAHRTSFLLSHLDIPPTIRDDVIRHYQQCRPEYGVADGLRGRVQ